MNLISGIVVSEPRYRGPSFINEILLLRISNDLKFRNIFAPNPCILDYTNIYVCSSRRQKSLYSPLYNMKSTITNKSLYSGIYNNN